MTALQAVCADVAHLQNLSSGIGLQRIFAKQAGPRPGATLGEREFRAGFISVSLQLRIYADRFASVVAQRAAANESMMEPEAA